MISKKQYNIAVEQYSANLFRFLTKQLRDKQTAEDIIQDCFLKLWQHKDNVDHTKVKSWLFTTAYHFMLNGIRRSNRNGTMPENAESLLYTGPQTQELKEIIDKTLDLLPEIQKSIVLLRDLEGYEYKEIGEMLSLTESQVKVYLFRARQKIKETIKELHLVL